jgi:precorrin-6B methylase 2
MLSYPAVMHLTKNVLKDGSKIIINAHAADTSYQKLQVLSSNYLTLVVQLSCSRSSFSEFSSTDFPLA